MNARLPAYERPTIRRQQRGLMNKISGMPTVQATDHVDGVPVEELVSTYGSPLFVYSEGTIRDKVRELQAAFAGRWPDVRIAWSYKTCYLDAVCKVMHSEGAMAEAVSGMEVEKALRNGVSMDNIVFNGPHKEDDILRRALQGGAMINVDHFEELAQLERLAGQLGVVAPVGIRVNLQAGDTQCWDRFGFSLENGRAWDAVRRLLAGGRLSLRGLHCHLGTFINNPDAYGEAAGKLADFTNRLSRELGVQLEYIDLGGGFPSSAKLKASYNNGRPCPSFDAYAQAITEGLRTIEGHAPALILETGRALVDDAGTLVSTVLATKRLTDGRRALVADAGVNVLFTSFWYEHDLTPTQPVAGLPEPTVVYGPLCMNIDVICEHRMLPPFEAGQRFLMHPVGAYNVTQSMQFIHLRPAVAMIGLCGEHEVIRRKETLDDLVVGESTPDWLNQ
jgi:diaminopimelate decarboxylase